jgi:hypothetical protein
MLMKRKEYAHPTPTPPPTSSIAPDSTCSEFLKGCSRINGEGSATQLGDIAKQKNNEQENPLFGKIVCTHNKYIPKEPPKRLQGTEISERYVTQSIILVVLE